MSSVDHAGQGLPAEAPAGSIGSWVGGFFGSFVAALLSIPVAGALQIIAKELWQATALGGLLDDEPAAVSYEPASTTRRRLRGHRSEAAYNEPKAP